MRTFIKKRVKALSLLGIITVAMIASPNTADAASCIEGKEQTYSQFVVNVPENSEFGSMSGQKFNVFGENKKGNAYATEDRRFFMNKNVEFSARKGDQTTYIDVNRVMHMHSQSSSSSFDGNCWLKDKTAQKLGFSDTEGLIEAHNKAMNNIKLALKEELWYSDKVKEFVFDKVSDGDIDLKKLGIEGGAADRITGIKDGYVSNGNVYAVKTLFTNYFKEMKKGGEYASHAKDFTKFMKAEAKPVTQGKGVKDSSPVVLDKDKVPYVAFVTKPDYQMLASNLGKQEFAKAKDMADSTREAIEEGTIGKSEMSHSPGKLIASPGMFTSGYFMANSATCEEVADAGIAMRDEDEYGKKMQENVNTGNASEMTGREISDGESATTKTIKGGVMDITDGFIQPAEDGKHNDSTMMGINCAEFGMMNLIQRLYEPVNITSSSVFMNLIFTFQVVAIGIAVLLVSIFGLYYATGNEATDPFKFLIRGFIVLFVVYYFPFFIQDILNVNNMLVHFIAYETTDFASLDSDAKIALSSLLLILGINVVLGGLVSAVSTGGATVMVFVLLLIFVIAFFVKAIVTLYAWWFFRFLMIGFLATIGPLFIVMILLPKTANYGYMWLKSFIGEVMTQSVMVMGLYFASSLLQNLNTLNAQMNLGLVGNLILVYGVVLLLGKLPDVSRTVFGGSLANVVGFNDAKRVGESVGQFVNNAGVAVASQIRNNARERKAEALNEEYQGLKGEFEEFNRSGNEITQDFKDRNSAYQNKMDKRKEAEDGAKRRGAMAKSMQTGKIVDDGMVEDKLRNTPRIDADDEKLNEAKAIYQNDMAKADPEKIKEKYNDLKSVHDGEVSKADSDYNSEVEQIENEYAQDGNEEARNKKLEDAERKHSGTMAKLNSSFGKNKDKLLKGNETPEQAADEMKMKANQTLEKNVRNAMGKGNYVNDMQKVMHGAELVGGIKSEVLAKGTEVPRDKDTSSDSMNMDDNSTGTSGLEGKLNETEQGALANFSTYNQAEREFGKAAYELDERRNEGVQKIQKEIMSRNPAISSSQALNKAEDLYDSGVELTRFAGGDAFELMDENGEDLVADEATVGDVGSGNATGEHFEKSKNFTTAFADAGLGGNKEAFNLVQGTVKKDAPAHDNFQSAMSTYNETAANDNSKVYAEPSEVYSNSQVVYSNPAIQELYSSAQSISGYSAMLDGQEYKQQVSTKLESLGMSDAGQRAEIAESLYNEVQSYAEPKNASVSEMYMKAEGNSSSGNDNASYAKYDNSLQAVGGQSHFDIGNQIRTTGIGGKFTENPSPALRNSIGHVSAGNVYENVTNAAKNTVARSAVRDVDVQTLSNLDSVIESGEVYYDAANDKVGGKLKNAEAQIVESLMQDERYSSEDASYAAKEIVHSAAKGGNVKSVETLPNEMKNMILTSLHDGSMNRKDMLETLDIMTGQTPNAKSMVEEYIQQIEKEFDGNWDVIKGQKTD